jgi:HK97 family phage prohead protease
MGAFLLQKKTYASEIELKNEPAGTFRATIATLNVLDRDGDVTVAGAFRKGQQVKIAAWGHNWDTLPVGMGVLGADADKAWVDGEFFLDTPHGAAHYHTVKRLGNLQEWSYGFEIAKWSQGQHEGQPARFLEDLNVFEASPVMLGAGIGTGTDSIKQAKEPDEAPPPLSFEAYLALEVERFSALQPDDVDGRKALEARIAELARAQGLLETVLKRTNLGAELDPRNLLARFQRLDARYQGVTSVGRR